MKRMRGECRSIVCYQDRRNPHNGEGKSAEMACLLDSEETGTVQIKLETVSIETKSKENFL